MAKFTEQSVSPAFRPYLQEGEFLTNAACGGYQSAQRHVLGCLLGPIIDAFLVKVYVVGLTNRRVLVIRLANRFGGNINAAEVRHYLFDNLPPVTAKLGTFATELQIKDPAAPFRVNFAAVGVPNNYQRGQMIAKELLARWENKGEVFASEPGAPPAMMGVAQPAAMPPTAPAQFGQAAIPQGRPQQNTGTVYGCLGAALIAFGSGLLLLAALVLLGMSLDPNKTTRETIGGIVGGGTMILFALALVGVGIYVSRLRRSMKFTPLPQAARPGTGAATQPQAQTSAINEGISAQEESITLYARDQQTAQNLCNDQYFLLGVLMGDGSATAKKFVEALGRGGSFSYQVKPDPVNGGYDVTLTLKVEDGEDSPHCA